MSLCFRDTPHHPWIIHTCEAVYKIFHNLSIIFLCADPALTWIVKKIRIIMHRVHDAIETTTYSIISLHK